METLVERSRARPGTPSEAAQRMRKARMQINEKALVAWGLGNIAIVFVQMFVAPFGLQIGINIGNLNKYFMFSLGAWIAIAMARKVAPLRLPGAMIGLVLVQLWFTVSSMVAQVELGRGLELSAPDYSLVSFLLCFLQASMLVSFFPDVRVLLKRVIVGLCVVSAFVAVLQFLNFGPAIALLNTMVGFGGEGGWAGQGSIRAMGIFPGVGLQVTYSLIAVGLIASALYKRKLLPIEIVLVIVLTGMMLMAQVRNALAIVAVVMVPLTVLFVKRHRQGAMPYVVAGVLALLLLVFGGTGRFDYMLSGDTSTLDYRYDVLWPQAMTIFEQRPWFGIGVEPAFAGAETFVKDRWSDGILIDNGYLVALAYGGLPAFVFMVVAVLLGAFGSLRLLVRRGAAPIERGFAIGACIVVLLFGYGMYFGNQFTNISIGMLYFIIAGVALPSVRPGSIPTLVGVHPPESASDRTLALTSTHE
ncbi:MAG: O-antigen ligase family protein [Armatimonadetes bacterium]|nr:O-antigen ligase family protein [Armatimonadota bacterium]